MVIKTMFFKIVLIKLPSGIIDPKQPQCGITIPLNGSDIRVKVKMINIKILR